MFLPAEIELHGVRGAYTNAGPELGGSLGGVGAGYSIGILEVAEDDPLEGFADSAEEMYRSPALQVGEGGLIGFGDGDHRCSLPALWVTSRAQDVCKYVPQARRVHAVQDSK